MPRGVGAPWPAAVGSCFQATCLSPGCSESVWGHSSKVLTGCCSTSQLDTSPCPRSRVGRAVLGHVWPRGTTVAAVPTPAHVASPARPLPPLPRAALLARQQGPAAPSCPPVFLSAESSLPARLEVVWGPQPLQPGKPQVLGEALAVGWGEGICEHSHEASQKKLLGWVGRGVGCGGAREAPNLGLGWGEAGAGSWLSAFYR